MYLYDWVMKRKHFEKKEKFMKLCIVYPAQSHSAYRIAAETFGKLAETVAGVSSRILTDEEFVSADEV